MIIEERSLEGLDAYRIRSDGEIFSLRYNRVLRGSLDKDGYRKFVLVDDEGRRWTMRRASLVCIAFHGPRPSDHTVRHLDGSRTNDAAPNLAWGTQSENCQDKIAHGTAQRGERNGHSVLTETGVRRIRSDSSASLTALAREFGVSLSAVWAAKHGLSWGWLQ